VKVRGEITKLVITFDQALDPASAGNVDNYGVTIPGHTRGRHRTSVASRHSIGIVAAAYDTAEHQVTLTLHTKLHQKQPIQLQINGGTGGVANTQGISLNSPDKQKPGKDCVGALDLNSRRSRSQLREPTIDAFGWLEGVPFDLKTGYTQWRVRDCRMRIPHQFMLNEGGTCRAYTIVAIRM
jgi:hypothetical protein